MSDNYNINTTQAQSDLAGNMDPNKPGMTLFDAVAANGLQQQQQAQLVQQAIEKTKQDKIKTQNDQDLQDNGGELASKGLVPKAQAIGELKTVLGAQDMDPDKAAKIVADAEESWPQELNSSDVRGFISALREGRPLPAMHGTAFQATADMDGQKEADGTPVIVGQYYEKNTDGDLVRTGQAPAEVNAAMHADTAKSGAGDEKQWQKLDAELNKFVRSSRGNSLTQAVQRGARAINELNGTETVTPQVLSYIQKDISGIFQGGVPPVGGADAEDFTTVYQKLNGLIQKYTGVSGWLHSDLGNQKATLLSLLGRLNTSTLNILKALISSEAAGYSQLIASDPSRWQDMVDQKMKAMGAGILNPTPDQAAPSAPGNAPVAANHDPLGIL